MPATSVSLVTRSRAVGLLGAAALLAFTALIACGSDSGSSNPGGAGGTSGKSGTGGKSGAGTSGSAHAAGNGAEAGMEPVSEAGKGGTTPVHVGGGEAGEAGMAEGGAAGASVGPVGPVCGNGVLEAGEQCDDGNKLFGDSCSPSCTNQCELCEKDTFGTGAESDVYNHCFGDGYAQDEANGHGHKNAQAGPAAGTAKNKLCPAVVACVKRTHCAGSSPTLLTVQNGIVADCFCGTKSAAECNSGMADGPCRDEIGAAAESLDLIDVSTRSSANTNWAIGEAYLMLTNADIQVCGIECIQGKQKTACQACAVGNDAGPCDISPCYFSDADSALCAPAADCALRTGCAANGVKACYGGGTGPCAAEFAAAAKSSDPASIEAAIAQRSPNLPLGRASDLLACEFDSCKADCFPSASGGAAGTSGAGGTSAASGAGMGGASGGTGGTSG